MQRLGAEIGVDNWRSTLKSFAPTWLGADAVAQRRRAAGRDAAGRHAQRMLRELAQALEERCRPPGRSCLWLEGLHWSDRSTLDAISFLARRSGACAPDGDRRLSPGRSPRAPPHPVQSAKEAIALHGGCTELALGFLSRDDVCGLSGAPLRAAAGGTKRALAVSSMGAPTATRCSSWRWSTTWCAVTRCGAMAAGGSPDRCRRSASTIPDTVQILIGQQIGEPRRRGAPRAADCGGERRRSSRPRQSRRPSDSRSRRSEICDGLVQRQRFITSRGNDTTSRTAPSPTAMPSCTPCTRRVCGSRVSEARRVEWQGQDRHARGTGLWQRRPRHRRPARGPLRGRAPVRPAGSSTSSWRRAMRSAGNAYREADRLYGKAIEMLLPLAQLDDPAKAELRMLLPRSVARHRHAGYATDETERSTSARSRWRATAAIRRPWSVCCTAPGPTCVAQGQLHRARSARYRDLRPCRAHVRQDASCRRAQQARPDQLPSRRAHHGARLFRECVGDLGRHAR